MADDPGSEGRIPSSDDGALSANAVTLVDPSRKHGAVAITTLSSAPTIDRRHAIGKAPTLLREGSEEEASDFATSESEPRVVDVIARSKESFDVGSRYEVRRLLGEGGMGEVRLCGDAFIGRDVAMKVVRTASGSLSDARARFLREARVQGQLEHPAVVPVYDLGVTGAGEVFFTMKRIVGRTLEEIIAGLRENDADVIGRFPRRKILAAMSQVSLALAFAHTKGVVHRDLKPANIMLGDFGEVYVLDWGVAKVSTAEDLTQDAISGPAEGIEHTQAGSLLGTPGYMSPEQARGEAVSCDGRADIYALGVVLAETLTLEPVHRGKTVTELVIAALRLDGVRPSAVDGDIPAELDAICHRATRIDPAERFPTARELHDAIEGFLDGERDRERQIELADVHTARAEELLGASTEGADDAAKQSEIMRELGAALALHPTHRRARRALLQMLLHEPDTMPPEAEKELEEVNRRDRAQSSLRAAYTYIGWFAMTPFVFWMGIRALGWFVAFAVSLVLLISYQLWMGRTGNAHPKFMRYAIWANFALASLLGVFFGPLVIVPQAVTAVSASLMVSIRANRLTRFYIGGAAVAAVAVPFVLGAVGVLPNPYSFENGNIVIHPIAVNFSPIPTIVFAVLTTAFSLVVPAKLIGRGAEALIASERRTFARAHRMRQLFPTVEPSPASEG